MCVGEGNSQERLWPLSWYCWEWICTALLVPGDYYINFVKCSSPSVSTELAEKEAHNNSS